MENRIKIERYEHERHVHLSDQMYELDSIVLECVKDYVYPMYSEEWEPQLSDEGYWKELNEKAPIFLAFYDNKLAGFIQVYAETGWRSAFSISLISVYENQRGTGVASELMNEALRWGKENNFKYVIYYTQFENMPSRKFVEKFGFEPYTINYYKRLE